ncbi:hypothetical protein Emed_004870 [Eimeria media]
MQHQSLQQLTQGVVPHRRMICVVRDTSNCPCLCHRYCQCRCCSCCSVARCKQLRSKALNVPPPRDLDADAWVAAITHATAERRARFAAAAAEQAGKAAAVALDVAAQARAAERDRYVNMMQSIPSKRSCTALVKQRQKLLMKCAGATPPPDPLLIEREVVVEECCPS